MLEMDILVPGQEVVLNEKLKAHVYPIGVVQLKRYSNRILDLIKTVIGSVKVDNQSSYEAMKDAVQKAVTPKIIESVLPMLTSDFLDVISECVMFEVGDESFKDKRIPMSELNLPHFYIPKIVTAWVQENFEGDDRLNPWKEAINDILNRLNKKPKEVTT